MDLSSSDEFDQLSANLPKYPKHRRSTTDNVQVLREYDDFVAWQLNRFNRSSTVSLFDYLNKSIMIAKKNCRKLCAFLPFAQILLILFLSFHMRLFAVITYVSMVSIIISTVSASMYSENLSSKFKSLFSANGAFSLTIFIARLLLLYATVKSLKRRSTIALLTFLLYFLLSFTFFFQSCFIFEGRGLSFSTTLRYSVRLIYVTIQPVQSLSLFLSFIILTLLGVFSFGFTLWMAYAVKTSAFLSISGSAASSSPSHPTV